MGKISLDNAPGGVDARSVVPPKRGSKFGHRKYDAKTVPARKLFASLVRTNYLIVYLALATALLVQPGAAAIALIVVVLVTEIGPA
jgi:hypothetical protein